MNTTRGLLVLLAGLVVTVAGCAQKTAAPAVGSAVGPAWQSCAVDRKANDGDALALPRLAAGFTPVAAVICRTVVQQRPGGGSDQLAVEDRATDVSDLVAAIRLPDQAPSGGACTRNLIVPPWLALIDGQGRWVRPGMPVDGCHHPRREVLSAIHALHTTRISSHFINTIVSDGAATSGCGQDYSDMAWATLANVPTRTAAPTAFPTPSGPVKVCIFRVPVSEQGGNKPGGEYETSLTLTPRQWAAVAKELAEAGPPAACRTPASRIAVFGGGTVAELDGCRMVLVGGMVRQGTPALAGLLDVKGR